MLSVYLLPVIVSFYLHVYMYCMEDKPLMWQSSSTKKTGNIHTNVYKHVMTQYALTFMIISLWPSDAIWRHRACSTLARVMAWCLQAPSHYQHQCYLIISGVQWHSPEGNSMLNTQHIYLWHTFENYPFEISTGPHRGQWVKSYWLTGFSRSCHNDIAFIRGEDDITCTPKFQFSYGRSNVWTYFLQCKTKLVAIKITKVY